MTIFTVKHFDPQDPGHTMIHKHRKIKIGLLDGAAESCTLRHNHPDGLRIANVRIDFECRLDIRDAMGCVRHMHEGKIQDHKLRICLANTCLLETAHILGTGYLKVWWAICKLYICRMIREWLGMDDTPLRKTCNL